VVTVDECDVLEEVDMFQNPDMEPLPELVYDGNPDTEVGEYVDRVLAGGTTVSFDVTA
jgi:hypothetical protein